MRAAFVLLVTLSQTGLDIIDSRLTIHVLRYVGGERHGPKKDHHHRKGGRAPMSADSHTETAMNAPDERAETDWAEAGCSKRSCRYGHSYTWGLCAHAKEPPPDTRCFRWKTVTDTDGCLSIVTEEVDHAELRAEIRAQTIRDLRDGKIPLAEIAAAQGITALNVEDLHSGIDLTDEEAEALEKALTEGRSDGRAEIERQVRAKVAEEMSAPFAMTNADISELCAPCIRSECCGCGEVYQRYFLRIARGGSDVR
jgi:hypothetical protein